MCTLKKRTDVVSAAGEAILSLLVSIQVAISSMHLDDSRFRCPDWSDASNKIYWSENSIFHLIITSNVHGVELYTLLHTID
jgi:hypothetical protein